jgi:hypothetical protein
VVLNVADGDGGVCEEGPGMNKLRSCLLAGAASLGLGAFTPAHAVVAVTPDPRDFVFIETVSGSTGTFTIINNSSDWYIWAFSVTNTDATNPQTTQPDWSPDTCNNNCAGPGSGVDYEDIFGAFDLTTDIGPGQRSSLFTFSLPTGSTPTFLVTNSNDALPPGFSPTGSGVPEPSTWAMLIAGFGFLGWRYARRRADGRRLINAT